MFSTIVDKKKRIYYTVIFIVLFVISTFIELYSSELLSNSEGILWVSTPHTETSKNTDLQKDRGFNDKAKPHIRNRIVKYTFRDVNFLSEDMVLFGVNPGYDFYIPSYRNLRRVRVTLKIFLPEYLRKDSSVSILVNDIPRYTLFPQDSGKPVEIDILPKKGREFIKLSVKGNLRLSNNICEDVFTDRVYFIISADSTILFEFGPADDINTFLMDYGRLFCIQDKALLPLVYYLSKVRIIPPVFKWGINDSCEKVIMTSANDTKLKGNVLYVSEITLQALQEGYKSFIFGDAFSITKFENRIRPRHERVSFRDLSIRTSTIKGMTNLSFYVPFNTGYFGGIPDTLYLMLNFSHTPPQQKDKMELRIYLNDALIDAIPLEGHGRKSINLKIPTKELFYGHNTLVVNLITFTSSENCFGAVTHSAITVFDDSYFYWNAVSKEVVTIADFLKIINGKVGLIIEDDNILPFVTRFLNTLALINKSIEKIDLIRNENPQKYDFLLIFGKKQQDFELFKIYDPSNNKVIFSAIYHIPFLFAILENKDIPTITFYTYGKPDYKRLSELYTIEDFMNLFGNVAVISDSFFASFDTINKLRLTFEGRKSLSYYWNKYKLIIVLILSLPILYFLIYIYKRLTRRAI